MFADSTSGTGELIPHLCHKRKSSAILLIFCSAFFPGGCSGGVTPVVPIPNTVAKPSSADGTGNGRVGRRRGLFALASLRKRGFFLFPRRTSAQNVPLPVRLSLAIATAWKNLS